MKNGLFYSCPDFMDFTEKRPYLGSLLGSGYTHFYACHKSLKRKPLFCSLPNLHKNTYEFEFEITSLHIFFSLFFRFHSRKVFKPIVIEVTLITFVKASLMKLSLMRFYCCNYFISDCFLLFPDPPEVSSSQRAVFSGPGDRDVLTCIVKAEPRANVSNHNTYSNYLFTLTD